MLTGWGYQRIARQFLLKKLSEIEGQTVQKVRVVKTGISWQCVQVAARVPSTLLPHIPTVPGQITLLITSGDTRNDALGKTEPENLRTWRLQGLNGVRDHAENRGESLVLSVRLLPLLLMSSKLQVVRV